MELDSSPVEIDELQRAVTRLEMEETYLTDADTDDAGSAERLAQLRVDLADWREDLAVLTTRWESEQARRNRIALLSARLDERSTQAEPANLELRYEAS